MDFDLTKRINVTMYKNRVLDQNVDDFMRSKRNENDGEMIVGGTNEMKDLIYELAGTNIIETNDVETASMEYFMNEYRIKINPNFI
ncbi:MAG: hypothetical protein AB7T10_03325, partial [bacterium]